MPWPSVSERFPSASAMTAYIAIGARFADGSEAADDVLLLCTGYLPALDTVAAHVSFDAAGAVRPERRRAGRRGRP